MQFVEVALITSKAKNNGLRNFFERSKPEGGVKKKFQKALILDFKVIVQTPVHVGSKIGF